MKSNICTIVAILALAGGFAIAPKEFITLIGCMALVWLLNWDGVGQQKTTGSPL